MTRAEAHLDSTANYAIASDDVEEVEQLTLRLVQAASRHNDPILMELAQRLHHILLRINGIKE